jgi:hypothetical protein
MTVSIDGTDIAAIAEGAAWAGSIVGLLIVSLIVYLLVRPPRHVRQRRKAEQRGEIAPPALDQGETEDIRLLADRMEARLQVLERALADQIERPAIGRRDDEELEATFAPAEDGRDSGRKA